MALALAPILKSAGAVAIGALKAVIGFLMKWVEVPVVLLTGLIVALGWQTLAVWDRDEDIADLQAQVIAMQTEIAACKDANDTGVKAVKRLQELMVQCVGEQTASAQTNAAAASVRGALARDIQRELAKIREERDAIYREHMACDAHRGQPVCSPLDSRLRRLGKPTGTD